MRTKPGHILVLAVFFSSSILSASGEDTNRGAVAVLSMSACCEDSAWPEAEDAVVAELELVDIPVIRVKSAAADDASYRDEMERIAEEKGASAAVRLTKSKEGARAGVALWIVDRVTGKTTYRVLDVDSRYDAAATIDVAVRVVEALRASFYELRITGRKEPPKESLTPAIAELVETAPIEKGEGRFGLGLSSSANISPGGTGPRGSFSLTGVLHLWSGLDAELSVLFSPIGKDLATERDISTFDYMLFTAGAFYRFRRKAIAQPALGVEGGALLAWTEGRTQNGDPLLSDRETVAYLGAGARLFIFPGGAFDMFLGAHVGATLPKMELYHGEKKAALFGHPLAELALGAQFRFM